jgi:hypothetical protein
MHFSNPKITRKHFLIPVCQNRNQRANVGMSCEKQYKGIIKSFLFAKSITNTLDNWKKWDSNPWYLNDNIR